jgi:class 3 adenylate cyclase
MAESIIIATLHVTPPVGSPTTVSLRAGQSFRIGRDAASDLVLDDPGVSRAHAVFSASPNGVILADLGSTNGTFVNGERIASPRSLNSGDIIDAGGIKIRVATEADKLLGSVSDQSQRPKAPTVQMKRVPIAVMVASVAQYHELTNEIPPEILADALRRWTELVERSVKEQAGTVDQSLGASVVALWSGDEEKDLAAKAAQAALRIRRATTAWSDGNDWTAWTRRRWECTLVLTAGQALTGLAPAGAVLPKGLTVLGDSVNQAFRLEELVGKLGEKMIVAASIAVFLKDVFTLTKIIKVKIKGVPGGVDTFTIKV